MTTRAEATRARLQAAALDLFEERGYRAVTVEEIATAAGVSHMTFFRHFPTKERVLLDDPFDPVIAAAVAAQPTDLPAVERIARGLLALVPLLDQEPTESTRRAIAIAAGEPDLQAGMAANTAATERAIVEAAAAPGGEGEMRIAAAACLAAVTAVMLDWAADGSRRTLGDLVTVAMTTVAPALAHAEVPAFAGATP
ncbi:TetR/AcrR family transcriptional regulator [Demequina mangrovi]|uniref:Transcriptional regulator, TetR family n=1 Tax=Demequina mangrovi TaxID=1043493 RepID=A0A1H6VWJ6_9MICO|nr:TetR/AcrR family transcriptional regulator [Demequina mangrovi]SEJ09009.1 transcriptional regulator, TetR family [Demequina mangrovi]